MAKRSGMLALSTIFWLSCFFVHHHNCLDAAQHIDSYSSQAVQTQTLISLQALTHLRFLSTCSWCQHIIRFGLKPKPVQRRNIICKADGCQNMWDQSQCFWGWPCQMPKLSLNSTPPTLLFSSVPTFFQFSSNFCRGRTCPKALLLQRKPSWDYFR